MISDHINQELLTLKEKKNYRSLPPLIHDGRNVILNGQRMVNLIIRSLRSHVKKVICMSWI